MVQFTAYQVFEFVLFICSAIVSMSAAITVVIKVVQKAKEPEQSQNDRISALEKKVDRFEQLFDNDNKRLIELEKGNRVTQQALLALLSHALNGDDVDSVVTAKKRLEEHLIGKED